MPVDLESLNESQLKAVLWDNGALLVLAGPGSGKTRVLSFRLARLLQQQDDAAVLALTFTSKAAHEMRDRVDRLLGHRGDRAQLCTFHSFAADVLRQHGAHIGVRPDFNLVTQDEDRLALLAGVANALEDDGHVLPGDRRGLLALIDRLYAEAYDGGPVVPAIGAAPVWVPLLFQGYRDALLAANRLDYGSLLGVAHRLLRDVPAVARVVRVGWTHVCVDEFQDTNKAQYELLRLIVSGPNPNLFVVGDDDQILYQWNGASPDRMRDLVADYEMTVVQLPENYRCPAPIVSLANALISHNQQRTAARQPLAALRRAVGEGVVRHIKRATADEEVVAVAADIRERSLAPGDCVVLARTAKLLASASQALIHAGIEAHLARRKTDFESYPVRVVLLALRLANARHDRDLLARLCAAWRDFSGILIDAADVAAGATLIGGDFLRAWCDAAVAMGSGVAAPLAMRVRASLVDRLEFPGFVDDFLTEGWHAWAIEGDRELGEEVATWQGLHEQIVAEHGPRSVTLNEYLQKMDLAPKVGRPSQNAVRCMTVHGAKGLEFKHVYLIGMAQEVLPSFQALRSGAQSRELEEERRNCFVAITRAQETLTFTRAEEYNGWRKGPSQFLKEMGLKGSFSGS